MFIQCRFHIFFLTRPPKNLGLLEEEEEGGLAAVDFGGDGWRVVVVVVL